MLAEAKGEALMRTILQMWAMLTPETTGSHRSRASEIYTSAKGLKLKETMKKNSWIGKTRKQSSTALDTAHPKARTYHRMRQAIIQVPHQNSTTEAAKLDHLSTQHTMLQGILELTTWWMKMHKKICSSLTLLPKTMRKGTNQHWLTISQFQWVNPKHLSSFLKKKWEREMVEESWQRSRLLLRGRSRPERLSLRRSNS